MENTEIMTNNEVVEAAEEIVSVGSGNGLKFIGGGVVIAAIGYGVYRLIKKIKAKKAEQQDAIPAEVCDFGEDTEVLR